jgi:tRNA(Ile)-lysidine synthase
VIECQVLKADDPRALPGWKPEGMSSEVMDLDSIRGGLVVRARQLGDAFVPLGAPGTQKVGDFLTNVKASPRLRRRVFCVCDAEGLVFLSPFRIADRVRLGPSTRKVLRLAVR